MYKQNCTLIYTCDNYYSVFGLHLLYQNYYFINYVTQVWQLILSNTELCSMQKNLVLFSFRKLMTFFFVFRAYADNLRNLFSIMPLMIIAVKDPLTRTSYQKELITAGEITAEDLVAEFRLTTQDFKKQGKFLYHNNWCKSTVRSRWGFTIIHFLKTSAFLTTQVTGIQYTWKGGV